MVVSPRPISPALVVARDASKVLDFLASHQVEFEEDFGAQFTENFRKHTSRIEHATLSVSASKVKTK